GQRPRARRALPAPARPPRPRDRPAADGRHRGPVARLSDGGGRDRRCDRAAARGVRADERPARLAGGGMTRASLALCGAMLATAVGLAWIGFKLIALPTHGNAVAESIAGGGDARRFAAALRLFADSVHETVRT